MKKAGELLLSTKSSAVRFIMLQGNSHERALMRQAIQRVVDTYSRNRFRHDDEIPDRVFRGSRDDELKLAILYLRDTKCYCLSKISKRREREARNHLFGL